MTFKIISLYFILRCTGSCELWLWRQCWLHVETTEAIRWTHTRYMTIWGCIINKTHVISLFFLPWLLVEVLLHLLHFLIFDCKVSATATERKVGFSTLCDITNVYIAGYVQHQHVMYIYIYIFTCCHCNTTLLYLVILIKFYPLSCLILLSPTLYNLNL